jgi:hypothetical protein
MRKTSVATALGGLVLLGATVGIAGAKAAAPPNVQTISVYRSLFSPSMLTGTNGLVVTLVNRDTISHRIVLYRGSSPTSFDVTLAPGQRYTSTSPLSCTGSCTTVTYTYRDAYLSSVSSTGYCNSFCARIYLYNDGS